MEKIYSRINSNRLLHIVVREEDIKPGRVNLIEDHNFLHCALLNLDKGTTFKPHKHNWREETLKYMAQESWHCISGSVKCIFYDIDGEIISKPILKAGDSSFTLEGGHNYLILEDFTKVLEFKNGPYKGQTIDKTFI